MMSRQQRGETKPGSGRFLMLSSDVETDSKPIFISVAYQGGLSIWNNKVSLGQCTCRLTRVAANDVEERQQRNETKAGTVSMMWKSVDPPGWRSMMWRSGRGRRGPGGAAGLAPSLRGGAPACLAPSLQETEEKIWVLSSLGRKLCTWPPLVQTIVYEYSGSLYQQRFH